MSRGTDLYRTSDDVAEIWGMTTDRVTNLDPLHLMHGTAMEGAVWIGRSRECDVVLEHVGVSRRHARLICIGNDKYLEDNKSANGTFVNGFRLTQRYKLNAGDVIRITNTTFLYNGKTLSKCTHDNGIHLRSVGVCKSVNVKDGQKTLIDHVSLSINPGEFVAVVGGSGAGKSTLLNCISGYTGITGGNVYINGEDLHKNYGSYKSIIAYVPQQDIVYDDLPLRTMLLYSAKMKMPADTNKNEIEKRVEHVLKVLELIKAKDVLIRNLSGGQKKRASIAVEMLSDPGIFFLDEPTSGLDPGTERNFMKTMKSMAQSGKTIIMVTHTTQNIALCDKVIFMGSGGKLCFCGSYEKCLENFGTDDIIPVYNMVTDNSDIWELRYKANKQNVSYNEHSSGSLPKTKSRTPLIRQFLILQNRYAELIYRDKKRLMLLLLQSPVIALMLGIISEADSFDINDSAKSVLFVITCASIWIGCSNTVQEICKERIILAREYAANLNLGVYIMSKIVVMSVVCFIQSLLLLTTYALMVDFPSKGILFGNSYPEMFVTTFLTVTASASMGILVSSVNKNTDRAMGMIPMLLIPQILFAGILFKLEGVMDALSNLSISKWSMQAYGTTSNLNDLPNQVQQRFLDEGNAMLAEQITTPFDALFEYTTENMYNGWLLLIGFIVIFCTLSIFVLKTSLKVK